MVEQFVLGRKYLKAVSPKTLIWYQCSFKAFGGATSSKKEFEGGDQSRDRRTEGMRLIANHD